MGQQESAAPCEIIDGKAIAATLQREIAAQARALSENHGITPGLAVVLVGTRKDSQTYVKMKKKVAAEVGFLSVDIEMPETATQEQILEQIDALNARDDVHGILVQLPLPGHVSESAVLMRIAVDKDVDGFSAVNIGNLALRGGVPPLAIPCTPAGVVVLLGGFTRSWAFIEDALTRERVVAERSGVDLKGKHCVVLGRSNIVGMPVALLLLSCDATVTVAHSKTHDLEAVVRQADVLVAAVGKPEMVRGSWLKPGVVVIDVGINAVDDKSKASGYRLVGDVCFEEAKQVASKITPVPGGVGPMTIALLMRNTLNLARHRAGLERLPLRAHRESAAKDEKLKDKVASVAVA